ncbi:MAG: PASTA domain-containing protein [Deltaproteobacteria bacterium]|nr:PASTA domain-containing protein [Deltaproteobacteria bacterium]
MTASFDPRDPRARGTIRRVPIPEVVGLGLENAKIVLSNAGFSRFKVQYSEDYADEFNVVDQFPRSGLLVSKDVEVQLTVSRQSLLSFLPQVFQQAAMEGASWLRGFLYIIQHLYDSSTFRLDRIHELFDPRTTDPEFLPWLGSWLAITLNPDWTTLQRRQMLLAATQLFPERGTARAVREFVRIYAGANVVIEENSWPFQGFRIGVHSTVGDDTVILPPMNLAHCFVVRLDKSAAQTPEDEIIKIHQIIQQQKPAHTSYFLAFSDEAESGLMGSFMSIGLGGDGGFGMGIGIGSDGSEFERIGVAGEEATSGLLYEPEAETAREEQKKVPKTSAKTPLVSAKAEAAAEDAGGDDDKKSKRASKTTPKE